MILDNGNCPLKQTNTNAKRPSITTRVPTPALPELDMDMDMEKIV